MSAERVLAPFAWVGGASVAAVRHVGAATSLLAEALFAGLRPPFLSPRLLLQQAYQIGVASIPLSVFCAEPFTGTRLRFCFAKDEATLTEAGERLRRL